MNRMAMKAVDTANEGTRASLDNWAPRAENVFVEKVAFEANWRARQRLNDLQWARVLAVLPGRVGVRAHNGGNARRFVEAVLWIARTGCPWRDLPPEFG